MKSILLICSGFLLLALANLPIGFYTLLRIIVTIGAVVVVVAEFEKGVNFWVIAFGLTAILFNPLIPVYLSNKKTWMPIDIVIAILFLLKFFIDINQIKNEKT
jgi:hypothetical protein